jgi:uncharacterized membrane protein
MLGPSDLMLGCIAITVWGAAWNDATCDLGLGVFVSIGRIMGGKVMGAKLCATEGRVCGTKDPFLDVMVNGVL